MWLKGEVGVPGACSCSIYSKRYENMLIVMVDDDGKPRDISYCEPSSWPECCVDCKED